MTSHTSKVAISVPARTMRNLEVTRRRLGRSRSSIVAEALDAWLAARSTAERDRAYLAGYERVPEPEEGAVAAAVMASWDSWEREPAQGTVSRRRRARSRGVR